jgi:hypothetical protein
MPLLGGVYVEPPDGAHHFRWVKAPTRAEVTHLTLTLAHRIGRLLERQGLLECDAQNTYLAGDDMEVGPRDQLPGSSMPHRIAVGSHQGRKVFPLQTLPACDEPFDDGVGKTAGFSLARSSLSTGSRSYRLDGMHPNGIQVRRLKRVFTKSRCFRRYRDLPGMRRGSENRAQSTRCARAADSRLMNPGHVKRPDRQLRGDPEGRGMPV